MKHPRAVPVVTLAFVLCLVGCGSGTAEQRADPTSTTPVAGGEPSSQVGQAFADQAKAACAAALQAKQAWKPLPVAGFDPTQPDPAAFRAVAEWLDTEVAPTFDAWLAGLTQLGTPSSGQEPWAEVLSAIQTIIDLNAKQVTAAKDGDTAAFVEARDELQAIQPHLELAATEAGVPTCAAVHR